MKKMDLNKKELISIEEEPSSDNSSTSLQSYYNKKIYEQVSFEGELIKNKPVNILYEKLFYGRVDLNNNAIIADQVQMKTRMIKNSEVKLQNFVFDAQQAFFSYWEYLKKINLLSKSSKFRDIKITSSWKDPGILYFDYMSNVFTSVRNLIKSKNLKIKNFDDFVNVFIDYVDDVTPRIPITFSNFVISKMADPIVSGLCFDVNTLDPTSDQIRISEAIKDPNYLLFKKTATTYGFFVDKHIPWRLYADIDSPAMKPYMDKYALTQDNLYNKNFLPANGYDLELLRFYLIQFYNTYITDNKMVSSISFKICEKTGNTIIKTDKSFVYFLSHDEVKSDPMFDRLIMKLYVYIKARENNYGWQKSHFDSVVLNFIQLKEGLDTKAAMRYIQPLVKYPAVADQKQRNFTFY